MEETENPENLGISEPTEGEQDESTEGEETPVIENEDDTAEEPVSDELVQDFDASVMGVEDPAPRAAGFTVTDGTEDKTGYDIDLGDETTGEGDFTFTVTPKENYEVTAVKYTVGDDSSEKEATKGTAGENGAVTYTIEAANLTGNITIKVTASKIKYTITVSKTDTDEALEFSTTPEASAGIESGETLTFTAKLKEANKDSHKISVLTYQVGDAAAVTPETSADGTYTIANVKGNVTITVTAEKIPDHKVTFTKDAKIAEVTDIKIDGAAPEKATLGSDDSAWEISAKEGSSVSFKLKPAQFYEVTKVMNGEDELQKDTDDVYTISKLEADVALTMEAELDETQCYAFTFAVAENDDDNSATVEISMPDGATDEDGIANTTKNDGDKVVSRNQKVILTFKAASGYQIDDARINATGANLTKVEEPSGQAMVATSAKYELSMTAGTPATVTVGTDAIGTQNANTVAIKLAEGVENLELGAVTVDGTAVEAQEGKYAVAVGAKRVAFTINATGAFAPKVTNKAGNEITAEVEKDGDDATYKYTVLASSLAADGEEFTVIEEAVTRAVTFMGETGNVNTVVSVNGKALAADALTKIPQGQTITVKVTQKINCALTAVSYKVGETAGPAVKIAKGAAEFNVKVTDSVEITVTAKGLYKAADLKDSRSQTVPLVKNIHNVSYDATYTAGVVQGAENTPVAIARWELLNGKAAVNHAEGKSDVVTISGTTATINLANADATAVAGKKLTLKLYVAEGEGDDAAEALGATYTLQLSKVITSISAPSSAKQPTDTEKGYKVTTNGEVSKLTIAVNEETAEDVIDATPAFDPETGLLVIKTGQAAGTANVVISDGGTVNKTISVTSTALISARTAKPTVKLKSASDIDLTLTLGAKKIDTPEKGAVLYEVKVTPVTGEGKNASLLDKVETKYFVKDGDSQDETITVANDSANYGDGGAWKYDVEVALVHVKDKSVTVTAANLNDNLVADARSAAFTTGAKPFATQVPAWEVNLKLKKGTTTVYTGQENAMIATPQFTKTTTYTAIANSDIVDITYPDNDSKALTGLKIENGQIYATATTNTAVGKHTVQVTAKAANTMYASRATVVVTVVRGIDSLGVTVPSVSVFKPVKRAATLKAVAYYNDDKTGKVKAAAPKTKKVKWDVVKNKNGDAFKSTDSLYGMVTVKNGTVTVNKDYVVAANDTDNQFVIKATVDNGVNNSKFIGSAGAAYSEVITITNVGADLSTAAIVAPVYGEEPTQPTPPESENTPETTASTITGYKVVAIPDGKNAVPVEASAITGGFVRAFTAKSGVAKDKVYTADELAAATVPNTDVSYKSSSAKNVAVDAGGKISVVKTSKAKLTVTANDGSKAKAELSLNVTFDNTAEKKLALKIYKAAPNADGSWTVDGTAIYDPKTSQSTAVTYNGTAVSRLKADVVMLDGENYVDAPNYTNFDISISGGKKTQQKNEVLLTSDKQTFKITLKDKSKSPAATTVYTLTNSDILGNSSTKIAAKALNTLHPVGTKDEQKVSIELSKIPAALNTSATADNGKLAATVEIDWNKLNDKNRADLTAFATDLSAANYEIKDYNAETQKGNIELSFNSQSPAFKQSSYALKVTVGSLKNDTFTASTVPAAATVKVDKVKKFTFKPTTSYTIGLKDAGAVLTGKSSIPDADLNLSFTKLLNANIKGVENEFTTNFEIKNGMLAIKSSVADPTKIDRNNLTGYLVYSATTDKDYYNNKGAANQIVKITVKVKDAASTVKYSVNKELTIENRTGAATEPFAIMAGNEKVKIANNYMVQTRNVWISPKKNDDGDIILTLGRELPANTKSFQATLYFAPEGSKYYDTFVNNNTQMTEDQWKENLKYAASVKMTVKVTPAAVTPPQEMEIVDVKTAVTAWAAAINGAAESEKPEWLTDQSATAETVETAMLADVKKAVNATDAVTYSINEENNQKQLTLTKAEAGKAGSVEATIKITKGEQSDTLAVTLTIPALQEQEPEKAEVSSIALSAADNATTIKQSTALKISATVKDNKNNEITTVEDLAKLKDAPAITWTVKKETSNGSGSYEEFTTGVTKTPDSTNLTVDITVDTTIDVGTKLQITATAGGATSTTPIELTVEAADSNVGG